MRRILLVGVMAMWVARRFVVVTVVSGQSMAPTYADGDRVVMIRGRRLRCGDVVVFRPPLAAANVVGESAMSVPMVKRIVAVGPDQGLAEGHVLVRGDAPRSVDSTVFGPVSRDLVLARAIRPRPAAA